MSYFGLRNVVFKRKWGERGKWGLTCAPRPAPTSAEVAPPLSPAQDTKMDWDPGDKTAGAFSFLTT